MTTQPKTCVDGDAIRSLARGILRAAVRGRRDSGGPWGEAVLAEFDQTRGRWEAVRWAAGGLRTVLRERRGRRQQLPRAWVLSREIALTVVLSIVTVFLVNQFVLTVRYQPSGDMEPTMQISDRWLIDRVSFRVVGIHHGDLVVHAQRPTEPHDQPRHDRVKRVIGLPGDSIDCRDGRVFRDGVAIDEPYLPSRVGDFRTDCDPVTVPPDSLYVLGDHRLVSQDSRQEGMVPMASVAGRVLLRGWPFARDADMPW